MSGVTCVRIDRSAVPEGHMGRHDAAVQAMTERDAALIEAVHQALREAGHGRWRDLEIEVSDGVVVLWGSVPTYYRKQVAQETVQRVAGVRGVANGLEVVCRR